jgi:pimeloyl-ACP methyl ester carboxylesterase
VRSIVRLASPERLAPTRIVWLPGAYHAAQDFLNAGFADAVCQRRIPLDLAFVDLEMNHLHDRSALQRLRLDIVLPARAAGVSIWLGGISLGGLFALDYADSYPRELDGLCLLAPYLGNRLLTAEISAAAGVSAWLPGEFAQADEERRVWRHIKWRGEAPRNELAPVYLGFGLKDRFAAAHELLAATLPAGSVDRIAGGHDWRTWTRLWENFLDAHFT